MSTVDERPSEAPASHRRQSGNHRTGESVYDLLARRVRERIREDAERAQWRAGRCPTQIIPAVRIETPAQPSEIDFLVAELEPYADHVMSVDRAPAEDCDTCTDEPVRPADVEVYTIGEPGADEEHERMCHVCALDELPKRPRGERVRIEVCTG